MIVVGMAGIGDTGSAGWSGTIRPMDRPISIVDRRDEYLADLSGSRQSPRRCGEYAGPGDNRLPGSKKKVLLRIAPQHAAGT